MSLRCLFAVLLLVVFSAPALADSCDAVLRADLMNSTVRAGSSAGSSLLTSWACSASLNEARDFANQVNQQAGGGGGSFKLFGLFSMGGGGQGQSAGSVTEEQWQRWQSNNCNNASSAQSHSAFEFFAQQTLDPRTIDAWKSCKLSTANLSCWVSPRTAEQVIFHYAWNSNQVELPQITEFTASSGNQLPVALLNSGERIYIGERTQTIARDHAQSLVVSLNILQANRYAYSCEAFVPAARNAVALPVIAKPALLPPPPPPRFELEMKVVLGRWCDNYDNVYDWSRDEDTPEKKKVGLWLARRHQKLGQTPPFNEELDTVFRGKTPTTFELEQATPDGNLHEEEWRMINTGEMMLTKRFIASPQRVNLRELPTANIVKRRCTG